VLSDETNKLLSELGPGSLKMDREDYSVSFTNNFGGTFLRKSTKENSYFYYNTFGSNKDNKQVWFFNHIGGGYNPDDNIAYFWSPNYQSILDRISKRETRYFYNGITGYFDQKQTFSIGTNSFGNPLANLFRPSNASFISTLGLNSDKAGDFRLFGSNGIPTFIHTSILGSNGLRPMPRSKALKPALTAAVKTRWYPVKHLLPFPIIFVLFALRMNLRYNLHPLLKIQGPGGDQYQSGRLRSGSIDGR